MAQRLGGSWNHMQALSLPCLVANASLLAGTSARAVARTSIGGLPCGFFLLTSQWLCSKGTHYKREPGGSHVAFSYLAYEVTQYHFHCILFLGSKCLSPAPYLRGEEFVSTFSFFLLIKKNFFLRERERAQVSEEQRENLRRGREREWREREVGLI